MYRMKVFVDAWLHGAARGDAGAKDRWMLVADSDLLRRLALAHAFSGEGFAVQTAADGRQLLSLLEPFLEAPDALDRRWAVILCELELPLVSGLELVEELRALGARLPIVLLGRPDGSAARQLPRTGVTATVDADCHLDELRYLVHHLAQREDPTALLPAGSPPGGGW